MIRRQTAAPLAPAKLVDLFIRDRRQVVEDEWTRRRYDADLLREVLRAMAEESRDPDSGAEGAFSPDTIRVMVKQTLTPAPSIVRMKQVLELLANPIVGAVTVTAGRYALVEDPVATGRRLLVLQAAVAAADDA